MDSWTLTEQCVGPDGDESVTGIDRAVIRANSVEDCISVRIRAQGRGPRSWAVSRPTCTPGVPDTIFRKELVSPSIGAVIWERCGAPLRRCLRIPPALGKPAISWRVNLGDRPAIGMAATEVNAGSASPPETRCGWRPGSRLPVGMNGHTGAATPLSIEHLWSATFASSQNAQRTAVCGLRTQGHKLVISKE